MSGYPAPGTPERAAYDEGFAVGRPLWHNVSYAASLGHLAGHVGDSDGLLAARVRGVIAGVESDAECSTTHPVFDAVLTHSEGPDSPVSLRRNPDCAAGKHGSCSGDAWDPRPAYDCRIECECICHDATDCQCGQDGCPNAAAVAQAAAEATYRDVVDAEHQHDTVDELAGVERVEVVGLVGDRDGRPHLLIDTSP